MCYVFILLYVCCMYSDILCMYVCMYLGEHLVQAMPFVPPLPCDKIDNNNNNNKNNNMLKNLPIIPSRISQNFYLLFSFS